MEQQGLSCATSVCQAILASMGEGIIFADGEDRVAFINRAAEEIRGIRAENYLGRDLLEIHSPMSAGRIRKLVAGLKNGAIPFSTRVIEVKGRYFENSYYPIRNETGGYVGTLLVSRDITEKQRLLEENLTLREQVLLESGFGEIIGRSPAMQPVFQVISATAGLDSTILITGESGTGKEMVAKAIHQQSNRSGHPLVKVNCAALPETLLESELFGHEKGAFTGAIRERKGKFEQAHRGTIFLDEIAEIPLTAQAKLLRVIQERTVERLGGAREIRVDVRIIVATNKELRREVEQGKFREDLFYRLNVIPVRLPPLRERREDILPLADFFLAKFSRSMNKPLDGMAKEVKQALMEYDYPGNVRELENAIERGVALCRGGQLTLEELPAEFQLSGAAPRGADLSAGTLPSSLSGARGEIEKKLITEALRTAGNRKGEAARLLNISRKSLWQKMKQLELG
ncbi:MAG: sigma 54-interacting transcriptional regulator [Geobacteraceae bacterium]|nr:sigma 54-interacting transcriptional regulator [Geobacteraceae bacterium]